MSSGFISEAELAEQRRLRQEQWEKVRKPGQPEECPEEEFDHRSLFERLEEQKRKRELEYEEAHKLKNMIKGLDDDEVEFLDLVDRSKLEEERRKSAEEAREINDFRNAVASLQERSLEERIQSEIRTRPVTQTGSSMRSSQVRLLAGAVVRKRPADATQEVDEKKARTENKTGSTSMNGNASMPSKKEESRTAASASSNQAKCEEESKSAELSKKRKNTDDKEENSDSSSLGLRCIGILPGLGSYPDSSDSEQSSDTDQEFNGSGTYDLVGRKVLRQSKSKSTSSVSSGND